MSILPFYSILVAKALWMILLKTLHSANISCNYNIGAFHAGKTELLRRRMTEWARREDREIFFVLYLYLTYKYVVNTLDGSSQVPTHTTFLVSIPSSSCYATTMLSMLCMIKSSQQIFFRRKKVFLRFYQIWLPVVIWLYVESKDKFLEKAWKII